MSGENIRKNVFFIFVASDLVSKELKSKFSIQQIYTELFF